MIWAVSKIAKVGGRWTYHWLDESVSSFDNSVGNNFHVLVHAVVWGLGVTPWLEDDVVRLHWLSRGKCVGL